MILSTGERIMYRAIIIILLLLISIGLYPNVKSGLTQIGTDLYSLVGDRPATATVAPVAPPK